MSRGNIIKRGSTYSVRLELPPDPMTGKRRQRWHSGYRTKRDAERARTELLAKLDHDAYVEPSSLTLGDFLTSWLDSVTTTVRASTLASYRRIVERQVVPRIGTRLLQKVGPQDLNKLYADLLKSGGRKGARLAPKSVRNSHIVLHRAFADAAKWGVLTRNPADHATPPRRERQEMSTWTAAELRTFLNAVADDPLRAAWWVIATTGMRRGEVLGLRWQDIDFDAGRASIVQQLTTVDHRPVTVPPNTATGRRSAALDSKTVEALREHRRAQMRQRLQFGKSWPVTDLVFLRADGTPIHPDLFTRWFGQRVRKAGLPSIRLHDLRHTWATLALKSGVHPKIVSEQLGHATIAITLDLYSHVVPAMTSDAVESVTAAIFAKRAAGQ